MAGGLGLVIPYLAIQDRRGGGRYQVPLIAGLAAATPGLAIGHAIGRIGCFMVGDWSCAVAIVGVTQIPRSHPKRGRTG
jgi:prolipoprotein diacylglyceryltransferase